MKIGLYVCTCGTNITATVDAGKVIDELTAQFPESYAAQVEFICAAEGKEFLKDHLIANRPDRVVVAACSPREYESTFMQILAEAGINPYYLQMVNIREQVAWVTPDPAQATRKATTAIRAAMMRVRYQEPLEKIEQEANGDVLVIGAGPAGLQSALFLAEAGRKVVLVEKTPGDRRHARSVRGTVSHHGVRPLSAGTVRGAGSPRRLRSQHRIAAALRGHGVTGYYGNFTATIKQAPRFVGTTCIGCGMCVEACPASAANEFNCGMDEKKAIAMPFLGALPNLPYIDPGSCLRSLGQDCQLCLDACPMPGAVDLEDPGRIVERKVGAIILAIGSKLYDCSKVNGLDTAKSPASTRVWSRASGVVQWTDRRRNQDSGGQ